MTCYLLGQSNRKLSQLGVHLTFLIIYLLVKIVIRAVTSWKNSREKKHIYMLKGGRNLIGESYT